ncbi:reverse transcriptase [Gossypium australe]|uniref:Reverse transcriptase n=1 Tax=Gossypium australe TaxID=47621 RepID=A0A5B6WNZ1_9ROSI|nr:reverse transcriptase [Gossypium australe]
MEHEQVNFMGNNSRPQNNPYSNNYNVGWRNHPNFSWGALKNQQESIHWLKNQIGQLAKLVLERPQEAVVKSDEVEESKKEHKLIIKDYKLRVPYPVALKRDHIKEQYGKFLELLKKYTLTYRLLKPFHRCQSPGSFTIPSLIGSLNVGSILADLRAIINVMPYKMFKHPGLG